MDADSCAPEDKVFAWPLYLRISSFCDVDKDDDLDEMGLLVVTVRG